MRLLTLLLFVCCLHVTARSLSQTISYAAKNVSLHQVFREVEKQTGFTVFGNKDFLKNSSPVSVQVVKMPLKDFLDLVLSGRPLQYRIEGTTIVLSVKPVAKDQVIATDTTVVPAVKGRVFDSTGAPVVDATIMVRGMKKAVRSNNQGEFSVEGVPPNAVLVVSGIAYQTKEVKVQGTRPLSIELNPKITDLSEVEVVMSTGYQTLSRERATGAYSVVSGEKLQKKLRPDLKAALEGQVPGMVLTKDGNLEIRGISTFQAESAPLIVVDGYPITGGLETVNIDNIETITVLKDAVAASIYGARSSNGVIVITLKRGQKGRPQVEYRGSTGITLKPDLSRLNRAGSADYIEAEMELYNQNPTRFYNLYNNSQYLSRLNYLLVGKTRGFLNADSADAVIESMKQHDGLGQLEDHLFRHQLMQQHNVSISAGGDKSLLHGSFKYISNRGNMLHTKDNRAIIDLNNEWKLMKYLSVKLFSNVNYSTSQQPVRTASEMLTYLSNSFLHPYDLVVDPVTNAYQDIFATNPKKNSRYADIPGLRSMEYNPLADLALENSRNENLQLRIGGSINWQIMNGLQLEAGGAWTRGNAVTRIFSDKESYRMRLVYNDGTSVSDPAKHYIPYGDMVNETRSINQAYTLRAQLNYNKSFQKNYIAAIAGMEVIRDELNSNAYPTRFGYNDQAGSFAMFNYADYNAGLYAPDMLGTTRPIVTSGSYSYRDNRFTSWYANAAYEYDRRFLLSGSIRLDLTNFFGTDPRFRYRPLWSIGGTYKLSNEKFFQSSWIDRLYLRGSYGINGNISLNSGPFLILYSSVYSNHTGGISYGIFSPPNKSLRWEKTNTTNIGMDMSFLGSRINLTIDYYRRTSRELLSPATTDPTTGYLELTRNVGQINNNGLELMLEGHLIKTSGFNWRTMLTLGRNFNKVVRYDNAYLYASSLTGPVNIAGYAADALFSYRFANLSASGTTLYYNNAKEKVGGENIEIGDMQYSGTLRPKMVYGLTNTLQYKNFELSFMVIAKTGNVMRKDAFTGGNYQNKYVANRWRVPGDEHKTIFPRLMGFSSDAFYFPFSDVFIESANYLKLRDASFAYTFNRPVLKKIGFNSAKLSLQGRNLFLLAANSNKLDPETAQVNTTGGTGGAIEQAFYSLPLRPEFYLGISVEF
jgi:TonB-linked SusC/RagA family outer membrane protein